MNETLAYTGLKIETNTEYTPDSLEAFYPDMILSVISMRTRLYTAGDIGKAGSSAIMKG